jgi:hypothetical protein
MSVKPEEAHPTWSGGAMGVRRVLDDCLGGPPPVARGRTEVSYDGTVVVAGGAFSGETATGVKDVQGVDQSMTP